MVTYVCTQVPGGDGGDLGARSSGVHWFVCRTLALIWSRGRRNHCFSAVTKKTKSLTNTQLLRNRRRKMVAENIFFSSENKYFSSSRKTGCYCVSKSGWSSYRITWGRFDFFSYFLYCPHQTLLTSDGSMDQLFYLFFCIIIELWMILCSPLNWLSHLVSVSYFNLWYWPFAL